MVSDNIGIYLSGLRSAEKEVRALSMENLVKTGTSAVSDLQTLLEDDNWVIRYRAAEALGGIGDIGSIDPLIRLTSDPKDHVRYMATKSLGRMQDPRVVPVLTRMLSDDHSYTRRIAADGLSMSGDNTIVDSLQEAMKHESDPDVLASLSAAIKKLEK